MLFADDAFSTLNFYSYFESKNQPVYSYGRRHFSFINHKGIHTMSTSSSSKGTALITGASTGIGAVYADRLAERGYDLILIARNAQLLSEVATMLSGKTGRKVETIAADLTKSEDLRKIEDILKTNTAITMLVNNAGFGSAKPVIGSPVEEMENMIELNVTSLTRLTMAVLPAFLEKKSGAIINIASIVALTPELLNGVYNGTKAFVVSFTQSLYKELKDKGVQIQATLPGATASPFWDRAGAGGSQNVPAEMLMSAEEMVDASLVAFDQGELITIPSLPNVGDWEKFEAARLALTPNLSLKHSAERYGVRP